MLKAYWDISNKCNLKCAHCAVDKEIKSKKELLLEEYVEIIGNLKNIVSEIDLLGGEPLLNKKINSILDECERNNIIYNIISNGQFSSIFIEELLGKRKCIGTILISIEGLENENDIIRGKGTFKKAVNCIKTLMSIRNKSLKKFQIGINMTINNINKNSILKIIDYFIRDLNVDYIQFTPMRKEGRILENQDLLINELDLLKVYMELAEYILSNKVEEKVRVNFLTQLIPEFLNAKYGTNFIIENEGCLAVENTIYINSEGLVKYCRESENFIIDLKKESLRDNFQRFSNFMLKKDCIDIKKCECDCIYEDTCITCIYEENLLKNPICTLIEQNYDIDYLSSSIIFEIEESSCMYEDKEKDCFTILYPQLSEKVDYEDIGYRILEELKIKNSTAKEISLKIDIDYKLVFRFLIQEQSKKHVRQYKG